jgi:hypothetical protein
MSSGTTTTLLNGRCRICIAATRIREVQKGVPFADIDGFEHDAIVLRAERSRGRAQIDLEVIGTRRNLTVIELHAERVAEFLFRLLADVHADGRAVAA